MVPGVGFFPMTVFLGGRLPRSLWYLNPLWFCYFFPNLSGLASSGRNTSPDNTEKSSQKQVAFYCCDSETVFYLAALRPLRRGNTTEE